MVARKPRPVERAASHWPCAPTGCRPRRSPRRRPRAPARARARARRSGRLIDAKPRQAEIDEQDRHQRRQRAHHIDEDDDEHIDRPDAAGPEQREREAQREARHDDEQRQLDRDQHALADQRQAGGDEIGPQECVEEAREVHQAPPCHPGAPEAREGDPGRHLNRTGDGGWIPFPCAAPPLRRE